MKYTFLFCLLITALSKAKSQNIIFPEKDGKVYYSEVIQVDTSLKKNDLFNTVRKWFAEAYKSANDVIQLQDRETGEIVGKGIVKAVYKIPLNPSVDVSVYHTINISVKDGRFRYVITDLRARYYSSGTQIGTSYIKGNDVEWTVTNEVRGNKKNTTEMYRDVHAQILALIESLTAAMKTNAKSDNW